MTSRAAVFVILSGFCFGFLGLWGKWAYSLGLTFGELLAVRFLVAAAVLFTFLFFQRGRKGVAQPDSGGETRPFPWLTKRELLICLGLGILGYAVFASCYFYALTGLSVSLTVLLLYLYPVIVAVAARVFLGEKLGPRGRIGLPIAMVGTVLLVWGEFSVQNSAAFFAGVMSAVVYSGYILVSRKTLGPVDSVVATAWIQLGTGVVLGLVHFRSLDRLIEVVAVAWLPLLGISIISTVLAMTLFLMGLKGLRAAEASILNTAEPLTAIVAAGLLLGERLSWEQILGGALVLGALILIALRPSRAT